MGKQRPTGASVFGIIIGDLAALHVSIILSFLLRYLGKLPPGNFEAYLVSVPWISISMVLSLFLCGLYELRMRDWLDDTEKIAKVVGLQTLVLISVAFMFRAFSLPRSVVAISAVLQFFVLLAWRRTVTRRLGRVYQSRVVLAGSREDLEVYSDSVAKDASLGMEAVATIRLASPDGLASEPAALPSATLTSPVAAMRQLAGIEWDTMIICPSLDYAMRRDLALQAVSVGKRVFMAADIFETLVSTSALTSVSDVPFLQFGSLEVTPRDLLIKRAVDVAIALVGLAAALPVILLVALGIKLTSPRGPVLLRQERVGLGGKTFSILKFRTMVPDAERITGPVFASEDDPRITPFGRLLRLTRIDELPQLFNVLLGNMSLVGPRPERPHFVDQFASSIPEYQLRHRVPAGITGLAQVLGSYDTVAEDKLVYDVAYASSWSLSKDFHIMLKTAGVMVGRRGAR